MDMEEWTTELQMEVDAEKAKVAQLEAQLAEKEGAVGQAMAEITDLSQTMNSRTALLEAQVNTPIQLVWAFLFSNLHARKPS